MKWLVVIGMLLPTVASAATSPGDQFRSNVNGYEGYRRTEERFDRLVVGCLQTYDNVGKNYNDQWHQELEAKAVQCADRLMRKIDEINYGPYGKQEAQ